jgi:alpha-tubulin suppressor-like RCC1 family protein
VLAAPAAGLELEPQTTTTPAASSMLAAGANNWGQLGNDDGGVIQTCNWFGCSYTVKYKTTPEQVTSLGQIVSFDAGDNTNLAATVDGAVWAWGRNAAGELGDETTTWRDVPTQVPGLTDVVSVAAGGSPSYDDAAGGHSMALKSDGTVWTWGENNSGQLGDGTTIDRGTPTQVSALTDVTRITAGQHVSYALRSDGTLWAWGANDYGQLGNGTTTDSPIPVQVTGLSDVVSVDGYLHTLAVRADGSVWAWGLGYSGQIGDGTYGGRTTPVQVTSLSDVTAVSAGDYHSLALRSDGSVWAWGSDQHGNLGDDATTASKSTPVQVQGIDDATAVAAGSEHNLVIRADGSVWGWGQNDYGQVGDGTRVSRAVPVPVPRMTGAAQGVSAGGAHSLIVGRVPSGPLNVQATAGNGSADISWSAPTDPGSGPLTGYTVSTAQGTPVAVVRADTTTVTASNLSNGRTYRFRIAATNAYATGPASTTSAVTPMGPPGGAGNVTAIRRDHGATVTWAPAAENGSPIAHYTVTGSNGRSMEVLGDRTRVTFDGLTNGQSYSFTVVATNALGDGPVAASNAVVPAGVPGRPGRVRAVAGTRSATVTWQAAAGNGAPVSSYRINTGRGRIMSVPGSRRSATLWQLRKGVRYTFSVRAVNGVGAGPTALSNPVTPHG